jgi:Fur family peroxide stress response transcriptional regulator
MTDKTLVKILVDNSLKVTPQRIAILEVILNLNNHPTAENIVEYLRLSYPSLSLATIYKTLNTFSKKGIIKKVLTENEVMRYDPIQDKHHHLYHNDSGEIEDFYDEELNKMLDSYFNKKKIPNFVIEDIKLQITGRLSDK